MMPEEFANQLLDTLTRADKGEIPVEGPFLAGACNVGYRVSGWEIHVFDDAGDWDYIEKAVAPDGAEFGYDDLPGAVVDWTPESERFPWKSTFMHEL